MDPKYSIVELLEKIMNTVETIFEQASVALPTRRYLYAGDRGETAHDCEQVTVSMAQVYSGPPGVQAALPSRCNDPRTAVIFVEIVRCIPDKLITRGSAARAPLAEDLTMSAKAQAVDAWLLMDAGLTVGDDFLGSIATVSAGSPSGGYQAIVLELATAIG